MRLFGIKTKDIRADTVYSLNDKEFLKVLGIDVDSVGNRLGEITYFTCLKLLSEIMGKLDVRIYKNTEKKGKERALNPRLEYLLNVEPNKYYTASTMKQAIELNRNHYGNAYVYIETQKKGRAAGEIRALWLLPTTEVTIWIDDKGVFGRPNGVWYEWQDSRTGKRWIFRSDEILHFKSSVSFDGISGIAIKDIIGMQIDSAYYGERYIHRLHKGNMVANKVLLHYTGDMEKLGKRALVESVEEFSRTGTYIPVPPGIKPDVLDSKLVDSEFSVLSKAKALAIAAAFGISPNGINDYSKSSYANSVTQQTSLYVNTMQPIFKGYGEEYTRKMVLSKEKGSTFMEIETKALFKMNPIEQMDVLHKGAQSFLVTPNEGREELGLPYSDHPKANELIGNGNMINLDNVGSQYKKGGEN
ncbi:phage portal protein [Anaerotignum sp. MB30-C6]|uniref:phage portal protein n=1 Tax=Anaerotignum sp. MB30-C6 TaxID=3070814 RepID=UPI0027DB14F0|nr:phage portal protein [Anaerotignum sp. MB30-C6]WMI80911.1 phage portal protein [Anaerotignum sp. MB30-C6]